MASHLSSSLALKSLQAYYKSSVTWQLFPPPVRSREAYTEITKELVKYICLSRVNSNWHFLLITLCHVEEVTNTNILYYLHRFVTSSKVPKELWETTLLNSEQCMLWHQFIEVSFPKNIKHKIRPSWEATTGRHKEWGGGTGAECSTGCISGVNPKALWKRTERQRVVVWSSFYKGLEKQSFQLASTHFCLGWEWGSYTAVLCLLSTNTSPPLLPNTLILCILTTSSEPIIFLEIHPEG